MKTASKLRDRLRTFSIRAKKKLGQNFLHDEGTLDAIQLAVASNQPTSIIEIGPGPGLLTERLCGIGVPVVAIEKDGDLVQLLNEELVNFSNLRVIEHDFLKLDLLGLAQELGSPAVVGNIPYNISTPILLKLLENRHALREVTLMMQLELAQRIRADISTKARGSLSVLFQLFATISRVKVVDPGCFTPAPKVKSEVIQLRWLEESKTPDETTASNIEKVVRQAFTKRRKTLRNALQGPWSDVEIDQAFSSCQLDSKLRPENLTVEQWASLAHYLVEKPRT